MKFNINGNEIEVKDEDLTKAMEEKAESLSITTDSLVIRTKQDDATFKQNTESAAQGVGMEIGRKNLLKGLGIEVDGAHKDESKSIDALNGFVTTSVTKELANQKIEPDKKVQELLKDKEALVSNLASVQNQFDTFKKDATHKNQMHMRTNELSKLIPENTLNNKNITLTIMEATLKTGFNEHGVMFGIGADGHPMKNPTTLELLPVKDVVDKFFESNPELLKPSEGGAGGGDSGGGSTKQTLESFIEEQTKAGNPPNSEQFNKIMMERHKAGLLDV